MSIENLCRRDDGRSRSRKRHHRNRSTGRAVHPSGTFADVLVLGREDAGGKAELRGCLASVAARL